VNREYLSCSFQVLVVMSTLSRVPVALAEEVAVDPSDHTSEAPTVTYASTSDYNDVGAVPANESKDATSLSIAAGAMGAAGNSNIFAVTAASRFRVRRSYSQLSLGIIGNYAQGSSNPAETSRTTVKNILGKARYDRFLGKGFAGFLALSGRNDRFQGLVLRTNLDSGFSYYFVDNQKQLLWTDIGYDYQYDLRRSDTLARLASEGIVENKAAGRHGSRLSLGYDIKVNEKVYLAVGIEYLQSLEDSKHWQLNSDFSVTSALSGSLSLALTLGSRYDNAPLPTIRAADSMMAANLIYQLL